MDVARLYLANVDYSHQSHKQNDVSNNPQLNCIFNNRFGIASIESSKLRVTGLLEGNTPPTCGFPAQRAS